MWSTSELFCHSPYNELEKFSFNGWCKLNIDGLTLENHKRASKEGLIRDCNERWSKGFTQNIGCGGERPGSPYLCISWAKGPIRGRTPSRPGKAEDKGNGLPLRVTLRTIPWKMISIKKEQDKGRHENIYEKAATIALNALQLTEPFFQPLQPLLKTLGRG